VLSLTWAFRRLNEKKSLNAAGLKTIGEIRAMPDDKLRRMRGVGTGSLAYLRKIGTGLKVKGK
jgi:hypothetical protein